MLVIPAQAAPIVEIDVKVDKRSKSFRLGTCMLFAEGEKLMLASGLPQFSSSKRVFGGDKVGSWSSRTGILRQWNKRLGLRHGSTVLEFSSCSRDLISRISRLQLRTAGDERRRELRSPSELGQSGARAASGANLLLSYYGTLLEGSKCRAHLACHQRS